MYDRERERNKEVEINVCLLTGTSAPDDVIIYPVEINYYLLQDYLPCFLLVRDTAISEIDFFKNKYK